MSQTTGKQIEIQTLLKKEIIICIVTLIMTSIENSPNISPNKCENNSKITIRINNSFYVDDVFIQGIINYSLCIIWL